ncbi:hypothetical protein QL285_081984 [Trifolium repens]|nr:hypothetical protein QL285_081984 [Trifolium repens]
MHSEPCSLMEIKGSCRGFILFLYIDLSFYLWNPSTGVHKNIPLSPLSFILEGKVYYFYGFGYDRSTDDYLIVSMPYDINTSYLEFFSLRANQWKQIDEGTHHIRYSNATEDCREEGLLFNGVIHWFAHRNDLKKDFIVAFDLMERKLLEMNLPHEFDHELHSCGVWVFQEFLSLWAMEYVYDYDYYTLEIWVMKEYKVHSSWTKTRVLLTDSIPSKYFSPRTCTKGGDIFGLDSCARFVKYNDEGQFSGHSITPTLMIHMWPCILSLYFHFPRIIYNLKMMAQTRRRTNF